MIVVKELTKTFGDKKVIDTLSFSVDKGSICGLIGRNGAGKTTLMKIMCGLLSEDSGYVKIDEFMTSQQKNLVRAKIGYVPQKSAIYFDLSGLENLRYFGAILGLSGQHLDSEITRVVNIVDLDEQINIIASKYSGGMQKRLNLAIGLLGNPEILFLDEPTVGVDPQTKKIILNALEMIVKKENVTIIYTSHYLEEVEKICDALIILECGKILAQGNTSELLKDFKTAEIRLAKPLELKESKWNQKNYIYITSANLKTELPFLLENLKDNKIEEIMYGGGNSLEQFLNILEKEHLC
ncbi:MAG: ABC transporter ATP-binding protein [Campylobacterales bacterium]|nr:ABC transporter ATP-binding protein [Campylobacterales bacterium]